MKAGRDLDALVAEKVMGWILNSDGFWAERGDAGYYCTGYRHVTTPPDDSDEWRPSADIAAAWKVVEKMRGKFDLVIETSGSYFRARLECSGQPVKWFQSTSAPHSICLAALNAFGHEV